MPAYDPKRPRPAAGRAEEPAPVEALLEPASSAVVEPAPDAPEVAAPDAPSPEAVAPEPATPEVPAADAAAPSDESPELVEETSTPSEVAEAEASEVEEPAVGDATAAGARRDADDLEVDLRDVSSNGSHAGAHEVPVAPAPNEVTTNRAVLVAGISVAALVAVLLRRRRRSD
jgi:hypothetical protein